MDEPQDERFNIEGDPEDALRGLLQTAPPRRVAIIVSRDAASRIEPLAHRGPVWVVQTPESEAAAERARQSGADVTTFIGGEDSEDTLLSIVSEVELHHGPHSRGPVSLIDVIGTGPTEAIGEELRGLGFGRLKSSPDGFLAYRGS